MSEQQERLCVIGVVAFFLVVGVGGLNVAIWQHNPDHQWEAVCWLNGLLTSWLVPLVIVGSLALWEDTRPKKEEVTDSPMGRKGPMDV